MKLKTSTYNLFYLFFCIIWVPLQGYYLKVDGAGRTVMALSMLAILFNINTYIKSRNIFGLNAFICWSVLCMYSFVNSMLKGFVDEFGTMTFIRNNFLEPYLFLVVIMIELNRNRYQCLKVILIAQVIYLCMGIMHLSLGSDERLLADLIGNMLPLTAFSCVFVIGVLYKEQKLKWGIYEYITIVTFSSFIIIATATRKAFGAVLIVVMGLVLGFKKRLSVKDVLSISIVVIVLYVGVQLIINNTFLGERINDFSDQYDVPLVQNTVINGWLMTILGDRAEQYYFGIQLFHQHPITGIGLLNYKEVTHTPFRLHTEYITQLCENGIIGFVLLLTFYLYLIKGLNRIRKKGQNIFVDFFGLLAILFINLTAWTYCMNYIMVIYAIIMTNINNYDYRYTSQQR